MLTELNRTYPTARKEHKCMQCGAIINIGEKYERNTIKYDNQIYDWVSHLECEKVIDLLNMSDYDDGEGIDSDCFIEFIREWLFDNHYNRDTSTFDKGFDPNEFCYHDIVLKIIEESKL